MKKSAAPAPLPRAETDEEHRITTVVFAIGLYCVVSIGIVFLNRELFSRTFQYPVFVSWFQQVVGFALFNLLGVVGHMSPRIKFFPLVKFNLSVARKILPLSAVFVGMIAFSNTCLKYVQVSTYQVARSLTLLFNLALSSLYLKMYISKKSWLACFVVISGFIVGSLDPATLSLLGVVTGAASSLFQAVYTVSIKVALQHVDNDENYLLFYNLGISSVLFIPVIFLAGETSFIHELPFDFAVSSTWFTWTCLLGSAFLGILLTFATYFCVRVTSPVTYNVTGYAKACIQSLGGIVFLGEVVTAKSITGILLTLLGSIWYSKIKMSEMASKSTTTAKPSSSEMVRIVRGASGDNGGGEMTSSSSAGNTEIEIDQNYNNHQCCNKSYERPQRSRSSSRTALGGPPFFDPSTTTTTSSKITPMDRVGFGTSSTSTSCSTLRITTSSAEDSPLYDRSLDA